ncbi:MAG TPA: class III lanthionine synthetase LanKC [Trebonia sp.]|jgi:hypothetical protein|nr:class III lanthionine synthetase LanKC [Trebonia sp.]
MNQALYLEFCRADRFFYDAPERAIAKSLKFIDGREIPAGWRVAEKRPWTMLVPPAARLPSQGWKVHVSATLDNAVAVLDLVWNYAAAKALAFKFLTCKRDLLDRNGKYANRAGSGKFITLYPVGDGDLEESLSDLTALLEGQPGPYILSDVRIGAGPVHVRYGGFAERFCRDERGEPVPAIEDPAGVLVPDLRRPAFKVPDWVKVPEFLAADVARLESDGDADQFPYTVEAALHFSNGGGIYRATDKLTGDQVVLREARPHCGLDPAGRDAVTRLKREHSALRALAGLRSVPKIYGYFTAWEHHFLVEEYIDGDILWTQFVRRYPLIRPSASESEISEYTLWALDKLAKIRNALDHMHERGITFADVHPYNIIIQADGEICFVDFETASLPGEEARQVMGAPGYVSPDLRSGTKIDDYAMACLEVAAFMPLTALFPLDVSKARTLVRTIQERFPVPAGFGDRILDELALPTYNDPDVKHRHEKAAGLISQLGEGERDFTELRASIVRAIVASATPERADRLFPGDIAQFTNGALGISHGAAGVLHSLSASGFAVPPEHAKWLIDAARKTERDYPVGAYDGLHGVAYALSNLGHLEPSLEILDRIRNRRFDELSSSLYSGLAGIGLNLLYFAERTDDRRFEQAALGIADRLSALSIDVRPNAGRSDGLVPAGLMHGAAGRALLYIRLYGRTGDASLLDLAHRELSRDLDTCVYADDGTLQLDEGFRILPYLQGGSAGIALVLDEYLSHRDDPRFDEALEPIIKAAQPQFTMLSALFDGRAGLMAVLTALRDSARVPRPGLQPLIDRHLRHLAWHAISFNGDIAFPGDHLMRLSMDLATGSAGVLLAISAALGSRAATLPLIGRAAIPTAITS